MIKNFVFSSVGDNTSFDKLWINEQMDYDIYVIYYGNNEDIYERYKSKVTYIDKRKGSKYQNFKYFYDNNKNIIDKYDRFFILDDDIIFNVKDINDMFKISRKYNLDICGPSFSNEGKISWNRINEHKPNLLLEYTNFVENNTALFSNKSLEKLMKVIDYTLIGWGIDYLYIQCNGLQKKKSYATIHKIKCINPKNENKKEKKRELEKIKNCNIREQIWNNFAKKNNFLISFQVKGHSRIYL